MLLLIALHLTQHMLLRPCMQNAQRLLHGDVQHGTHLDLLTTITANVQSGHGPMPVRASPFGNFPSFQCALEVLQLCTSFCSGHQSQVCIPITQTMFSQATASSHLGKALHAQPLDLDSKVFHIHLPKTFRPVILPACLKSPQRHSRTECCRSSTFWQEAGR